MNSTTKPIILHIPHASTLVPRHVRSSLTLSDDELRIELLRMTDMHTDTIFTAAARDGDAVVKFPVSRLVLDPERFLDDADEPMAAHGMGVVYMLRHDGSALRANLEDKDRLIREYYEPHHAALTRAVDNHLATHGEALIVDCHSFPSRPLPYELDQRPDRPEVCVGTDSFHTPDVLCKALVESFERLGYVIRVNAPFAGSLVPTRYFGCDRRVMSVMIELRRDLYMDEETGALSPGAGKLTANVVSAINAVRAIFGAR